MVNKNEKGIMDFVKSLCDQLATEKVTVQQAADSIGTVMSSTRLQLDIRPLKPVFEKATVVREAEGKDSPSYVNLTVGKQAPLALVSLENAFGPSKPVPLTSHRTGPRAAISYDVAGRPYVCTIFADLTKDGKNVTGITVRRDIRLKE